MTFRRISFTALLLTLTLSSVAAFAGHGHDIGTAVSAHADPATCRYARWDGRRGVTDTEARKMLRCAQERWPVDGGLDRVYQVVGCESGFNEHAYNPYSGASGLWQFLRSTWTSRRSAYRELGRRWDLSWSPFNARANAIVGTRMAHEGGFGPWGCA